MATLAFIGLFVFQPIMFFTIMTIGYTHLFSLLFEFFPTGFLIRVINRKIQDIHSVSYLMKNDTNTMNISEL
jgi:hypothetical protein